MWIFPDKEKYRTVLVYDMQSSKWRFYLNITGEKKAIKNLKKYCGRGGRWR